MGASFAERLRVASTTKDSRVALILSPKLNQLPLPIQRFDDPFLPFGKSIIEATRDVVCVYMFDFPAYMALGAAGVVALERTAAFARGGGDLTILHGPFASPDYAEGVSERALGVDAVTLVDEQHLGAYMVEAGKGAFIVRRGESPVIIPLPGDAGVYWQDAGLLTLLLQDGRALQLRVAGDDVLYAGRGDDFGERVRAALLGARPE